MLSAVEFTPEDKVLDLGCGYGVVGILAAKLIGADKVTMLDIDGDAVVMARENARMNGVEGCKVIQSDGFQQLDEKDFTMILSNPPYHADFSVPKQFIEKGFNRLKVGGKLVMVTKRLDWYKNKLTAVFGGVRVSELDGYFVFTSIKKDRYYAKGKNKAKRGK
jgi:16S rRNA (guanine1207-N2)-methyltransferase